MIPTLGSPNLELVRKLLASQEEDQEQVLARMWLVFRELMGVPWRVCSDHEVRSAWNQAYQRWASAAAWYGVHCHQPLACLAALKSLAELRQEMRSVNGGRARSIELEHPGCAIASSYYSLGKLLIPRSDRNEHFKQAVVHINRCIEAREGDLSSLLAVRGSVYRVTYRLGAAITDYKEVLRIRQFDKAGSTSIGDAMTELGFGYCCIGRILLGRRLMCDGLELLREKDSGFLVRGLRKMEIVNRITGRFGEARRTERKAVNQSAIELP